MLKSEHLRIRIDADTKETLKLMAKHDERSLSDVVCRILKKFISEKKSIDRNIE